MRETHEEGDKTAHPNSQRQLPHQGNCGEEWRQGNWKKERVLQYVTQPWPRLPPDMGSQMFWTCFASSWWIAGQAWAELFEGDRGVVLVVGQESRFYFQGGQHLVTTQRPWELGKVFDFAGAWASPPRIRVGLGGG